MRIFKALTCTAAAASLAFGGVAFAKGSQSVNMLPTSTYAQRGAAPTVEASELQGKRSGWLLALIAAAAVIGGIVILADGDDTTDTPG